jgi:DNA-directed RNA polymerase subunit RPC12/RpoP
MVEFRCIYCGRPVQTEESPACQRVRCPACGHSVPVRGRKLGDSRHGGPPAGSDTLGDAGNWAAKSNEEIAAQLLAPAPTAEERRRQALKMLLAPLLPRYDDLTLFTLSLAFLFLLLIDETSRRDLTAALLAMHGDKAPLLFLFTAFGMVCALVGVFLRRKKSEFQKRAMLLFAAYVTAGTGIYAGWRMLDRSQIWLIVFPAWNIMDGALLLLLLYARVVDTECILDEKATFGQVVVTLLAVPILLTTCRYLFVLHWSITFSIAVAYTMSLHRILRRRLSEYIGE